ncbi:MAG TPA: hypothetical protein VJB65_02460, partial [Patescibacteria group bacterium]|nr:hypothetical protein [Patescibacteria group bacterium]
MAHFLSQQRERIASCIIGAILLMPLCLYWKQSTTHIVITAFFIIVYILIASIGAIRFSDLLPALCIASLAWAFTAIRWHWPEMIERGSWISALFGDSSSESYFAFVVPVLLGWSLAWSLSRPIEKILARISKHRKFSALAIRYRFAGNIGFSLLLSTICAVVALLNHWSFQTNAIDYGLFDQVIYLLSRFSTPTSTVMQINNIFLDHQHFSSLILTAPFYWIGKGFHGATLAAIVPYMLITLPSILFYLIAKTIAAHHYSHTSRPYWVIGITSFLLSIHPFTQSAINFYFHEKYWMPIFFLALIYCGLQYLYKKKILFLVAGILSALIWAMLKEDQWIFVFVATLTSFVVGMFVLRVSHVR